jgi:chromosome segregation ATPase
MSAITFLVLFNGALSFNTDFSDQAWTSKPIAKVIGLLKDMSTQLEAEQKADADMYEEMDCWCASNEKEKTKAIKDANKKIPECEAAIEKYTALSSQLDTEITKLNKEIAKHTSGLEQATAIRSKESTEFTENEKDMTATISSLGGAVEALGKSQGAALLQVRKTIAVHMQKHEELLRRVLTPKQRSDMTSFIQVSSNKPGPAASGAIFGTLKQMKETFETNLADSQKEEETSAGQFSDLKKAKDAELAAMAKQVEDKTVEMADSNQKNAETKTDLEDTQNQLAADTEFLANVKKMCATADADYEARSKVRGEEIAAVGEAIGILTEDESKDSFGASGHSGFIQISSHRHRTNRKQEQAARILRKLAKNSQNPQLLQLAVSVQGPADAMKQVQVSMDELIAELKATQKEEVAKKDYCDKEIHSNEMETTAKEEQKADLEQLIKDLTTAIENLTDEIDALKTSIATMQGEIKKASEDRIAESQEFQKTVNEQKATQTVLQKALDRLNAFYASKAALVQNGVSAKGKQTPPKQGTYQKSSGASGALTMLEHIIEESKDVEAKATKAENEASADYNTFVTDSNTAITAAQESITSKTGEIAKSKKALIDAKADLRTSIDDLLTLGEASATLHQDCDFLLKHFTERQEGRASEIEGIQAAKAVLGGAKMFLQK